MIENIIEKIRDIIDLPGVKNKIMLNIGDWYRLCACLDAIEDAQFAIKQYKNLSNFDAFNGGYLYVYGLLQALFLQQDAVNGLSQVLLDKKIDYKEQQYSKLYEIREIRNNSIGHPTSRSNNSYFGIVRMSLFKKGFSISKHSYEKETDYSQSTKSKNIVFDDIEVGKIILIQSKLVKDILLKIKKKLILNEREKNIG
ncbi:MAG: hypothetical protein V1773_07840 [bacterium]